MALASSSVSTRQAPPGAGDALVRLALYRSQGSTGKLLKNDIHSLIDTGLGSGEAEPPRVCRRHRHIQTLGVRGLRNGLRGRGGQNRVGLLSKKFTKSPIPFFNASTAAVAVVAISNNRIVNFLAVGVAVRRGETVVNSEGLQSSEHAGSTAYEDHPRPTAVAWNCPILLELSVGRKSCSRIIEYQHKRIWKSVGLARGLGATFIGQYWNTSRWYMETCTEE